MAVQLAYVTPAKDTTSAGLSALLQPVANAYQASVVTFDDFLTAQNAQDARIDQVALFTVVGLAVLYTALSIANTCIMAITGRFRDFAVLRLGGATPRQVLGMVVIETCLVTFVALVGATVVTAAALAIVKINPETPQIVLPWAPILATAVACLAIALAASVVSALWAFRTPAIRVAAARE
jgi:putative ABC transport system permease protein